MSEEQHDTDRGETTHDDEERANDAGERAHDDGERAHDEERTPGDEETPVDVAMGERVYTEDGELLGTVRGIEENGLYVTTVGGQEALSETHVSAGQDFGHAELMWRCTNCGEMGEIEGGLPDNCPDCGVSKEDLMYWTED